MSSDESASRLNTRPSLLLRIRNAEDHAAWGAFVELYAPVVYSYSRRQGLTDADAADVVQDVLAQVARSIRSFDYQPERGRFRGWLYAVTQSKITRTRKRNRAEPIAAAIHDDQLVSAGEEPAWTEIFNAEVLRTSLTRIRGNFEDDTWEMFERVWIRNQPAADVARALNRPIHAVYVAKSRVLNRLKQEILSLAEDLPAFCPLD
jgi:RNA polymerase sigma-70 factor (ECF subfamily)